MSRVRRSALLLTVVLSTLAVMPIVSAQTSTAPSPEIADRLAQMEKQIAELQAQVAAMKQGAAPATTTSAQPAAATALVATTESKPTSSPFDGFTNILGGATLTGYVDTYYNVNADQPANHTSGLRSWDNYNSGFQLNMVNLVLDKSVNADSRAGYRVSAAFGRQMDVINGSEPVGAVHNRPGWDQYLLEAYFSYLTPVGKGLQVDIGKFVTPMGAEVVPTKDNWNYTRSILYDYAIPLYHYGLRAKYTFSPKASLTGFVLNGWNNVIDNNSGKTGAVSLALTPTKKLTITQNYMFGPEQNALYAGGDTKADSHWRHVIDTTVAYAFTNKLTFQTNFDYGRDTLTGLANPVYWTGNAAYLRYVFNSKYAVTGRYEYYLDHDGFTTGIPQHVHEVTGTFERKIAGHMITRFEFRRDMSTNPIFYDHSSEGPTLKSQNTLTAGVVYTLDKTE